MLNYDLNVCFGNQIQLLLICMPNFTRLRREYHLNIYSSILINNGIDL